MHYYRRFQVLSRLAERLCWGSLRNWWKCGLESRILDIKPILLNVYPRVEWYDIIIWRRNPKTPSMKSKQHPTHDGIKKENRHANTKKHGPDWNETPKMQHYPAPLRPSSAMLCKITKWKEKSNHIDMKCRCNAVKQPPSKSLACVREDLRETLLPCDLYLCRMGVTGSSQQTLEDGNHVTT